MKYAFMSFSTPKLSLIDMLAAARRFGYDGIEPRLDAKHEHGVEVAATPAQRAEIRRQAADAGVAIACLATSITYADPAKTEDMRRQTLERIDLAADVGAPVIRVFGGQIPAGIARAKAIEILAGSLSAIAPHAASRGVCVCMETHDDWCNPAHVAEVLLRVDHPAIAANWDIMHPVRTKFASIDESFQALKPWIRHLHVHDGSAGADLKLVPIGTGIIDHLKAIKLLKTIGYAGAISGEWIGWEPWETHLPRELATLRRYEAG
jgi:sugar phosphate isomerase/epimerase